MSYDNPNLAIVKAITEQHMTVSAAARRFGRSRQWIYTLLARYRAGGPEAVKPQSTTPHSSPHQTPPKVRARIIRLRRSLAAQGADNGPATIAWHLRQEGLRAPSESTIRRILHDEGLITPQPAKRPRSSYRRFQAQLPNECWQADVTHIALAGGRFVEVLDFLDDHSRYLLYLVAYPTVSGMDVVTAMDSLTSRYGFPASTLTDNGLVFTARFAGARGGKNGFETFLATHSIRQKNGRARHPQTQGKIERLHQTLKKWLSARPRPVDLPAAQLLLDQFRIWYNTQRPHRALGRQTPYEAYTALPKAAPHPFVSEDNRIRHDTVDKSGRITLRFAGQMRYLGIGRAWTGTPTLTVISGTQATTTNRDTGEVIAEHDLNPARRYQPNTLGKRENTRGSQPPRE